MMGGNIKKTLIILTACIIGGALLWAYSSHQPKVGKIVPWPQLRRTLMAVAYTGSKSPLLYEGPSAGKGPFKGGPSSPSIQEGAATAESTATDQASATGGTRLIPTFGGDTVPGNKAVEPEAAMPGWFAALSRKLSTGTPPPAKSPTGNIPAYYPSPSLAGSPKIQAPSPGSTAQTTPTSPQGTGAGETPKLPVDTGLKVATRDPGATGPGGTALEGTLGSTVESAILPSYDALYFTMPGQEKLVYDKNAIRDLDFNLWAMSGPAQVYDRVVTARFYTERTYEAGTEPSPTPEGCSSEDIGSGLKKMICQGVFPFLDGYFLRVIACGKPEEAVLNKYFGSTTGIERKLAAFLARAWIQGDKTIWDENLCTERRYLDYVFVGAEAHLTGVLEAGKVYFIVQFPVDYLGNEESYLPLIPIATAEDLGTYPSSRSMNNFLYNGRIVQVVLGSYDEANPGRADGEFINTPLAELFQVALLNTGLMDGGVSEGVPGNDFCLGVSTWNDEWVQKETALVEEINKARATKTVCGNQGTFGPEEAHPSLPLTVNATLRCAARVHSKAMNDEGFFSHVNPGDGTSELDGSSEINRIFTAGTQAPSNGATGTEPQGIGGTFFMNGGENIAKGPTDAALVVQEWLASPGHCANLMNPSFTHLGAGYHLGSAESGPLWTLTLGTPWK